jgi:hypothetical protein
VISIDCRKWIAWWVVSAELEKIWRMSFPTAICSAVIATPCVIRLGDI